jgi:DNA-binding transcriptional MerR regulator
LAPIDEMSARYSTHKPISLFGNSSNAMPTYTITELANEFDITPRAIRFYEDQGLIQPAREGAGGRIRVYSARERTRLKLTLRGKRLGLSLSEIKSLVDMYESPKDSTAQMKRFLVVLLRHREALEQQREDIEVMLAEIAAHEKECHRVINEAASAKPKPNGKSVLKKSSSAKSKQTA